MSLQRIWFITGCSAGLGREIALTALARGDRVIATAKSVDALKDLVESHPEQCRSLQLDITEPFDSLVDKAKQAAAMWGKIDVLVNNAGYSVVGMFEDAGLDGFMEMFKTNVFGTANVTNAFLPYMRERRSGTIVFVGSRSGWRTHFPANAVYGSSKAAVHAMADSLSVEVAPFNIKVLNVVPGGLRTTNIGHVRRIANKDLALPEPGVSVGKVPEYTAMQSQVEEYLNATDGTQTGDPKKAAAAIVDVVRGEGFAQGKAWTSTLFLGSDCARDVAARCEETLKTLEEWGEVARGIDF